MEAMRVRRQRRRASAGRARGAPRLCGDVVGLHGGSLGEGMAHPTWDHHGGLATPGIPRGSLPPASAVATSCLCRLNSSPLFRSTTSAQPFGSPLPSIHHRVDGSLSFHPPRREGPRNRPHRTEIGAPRGEAPLSRQRPAAPPRVLAEGGQGRREHEAGPPEEVASCRPVRSRSS